VRLWDPAAGRPHCGPLSRPGGGATMVYALGWSPDGALLASGSSDRAVHIWSARDGALVRSYTAPAGVFDVAFSADGTEVAAACANGTVSVLSLRR
jgi:transducin (beta)-like 1